MTTLSSTYSLVLPAFSNLRRKPPDFLQLSLLRVRSFNVHSFQRFCLLKLEDMLLQLGLFVLLVASPSLATNTAGDPTDLANWPPCAVCTNNRV